MLKDFSLKSDYSHIKIKSNFHTHNYLCGHAGGTVSDYVKQAVDNGMEILGISDHCMSPVNTFDSYITVDDMDEAYFPQFDEAERLYGNKIRILRAVEIEYFAGFDDYYKRLKSKLDYIVLGQHMYMHGRNLENSFIDGLTDGAVAAYFDSLCAGAKSGMFAMIAHPDLIFYCRPKITTKMCEAFERTVKCAVDNGVALELNANGIRYHGFRYPTDLLVELCKKYNARVVVSSDAHDPSSLCDKYVKALIDYAVHEKLNLIDEII